jgi:hypothetical protein
MTSNPLSALDHLLTPQPMIDAYLHGLAVGAAITLAVELIGWAWRRKGPRQQPATNTQQVILAAHPVVEVTEVYLDGKPVQPSKPMDQTGGAQ